MATGSEAILVIAAHPDDEVLGCGGMLLKCKDAGAQITVAFGGRGRLGGSQADEARAVADKAGWTVAEIGPFEDNRFGPLADVIIWMEMLLKTTRASRVLIHSDEETNQDHQVFAKAARIALRPFGSGMGREIWTFETPGSTTPQFRPNIYFDISFHWKRKAALLAMYTSERRDFTHPRSLEALEARGRLWAACSGLAMAEAFCLTQMIIGRHWGGEHQ